MAQKLLNFMFCLASLSILSPVIFPAPGFAETENLVPAQKEVMKFTDAGIVPPKMVLKDMDSSVFFVNTTKDALLTLTVDFGTKRSHCASDNMKFMDGKLASTRPIAPKDFALTCFPEKGTYPVEVHGLKKGQADDTATYGEIVVE